MDTIEILKDVVDVDGEPPRVAGEDAIKSDYAGFEELNSCSLRDEDELVPSMPKYSEFNVEFDMNNPRFKAAMKFKSFK